MTGQRWQQIEDLFYRAEELPVEQRSAFLDSACDGDADLRREVESLLRTATDDPGRIEQFVGAAADQLLAAELPASRQMIGAYEVLQPLGEGGMGVVYLARRADDTYNQQVAIKLIRPGFAGPGAVARFRSERQILANLIHPNIARLLDGGVTAAGQPYYVMEYVEGQPIDVWCRGRHLTVRDRLHLFREVCAGVQWAHQNLVVHRDLKPANILVCPDGTPKLLDFGVAKLLDTEDSGEGPRTRLTERMMTPEYASPEQIRGEPTTTATDVYALGVLLYELLTGGRPFEAPARTPGEMERMICEAPVPRPSTAARNLPQPSRELRRILRGDLDNIVLKAMHKEPARRYASAAELSEDIRHYLDGFPVAARPDSLGYRAGKFVRRHRGGVIAASLFVAVLIGSVIGMAVLARQADAQRARAERVSSFLVGLFSTADPDRIAPGELTARQMLDRGAGQIDHLSAEPEVQAQLLETFGLVYENLGSWRQSRDLLRRSLELKRRLYAPGSLEIAANLKNLAELARRLADYGEAEQMARESIAIRQKRLGTRHVLVAESENTLALVMHATGRLREAEQLFLSVLAQRDLLPQRDHLETAVLSNLGGLYGDMTDYPTAEHYLTECITLRRAQLGPKHPRLALALGKLAQVQESAGKLTEADRALRESLAIRQAVFGNNHPDVARSLITIASLERRRGRLPQARQALNDAAAIHRAGTAEKDGVSAWQLQDGLLREAEGDLAGAERVLRECFDERTTRLGSSHVQVARAAVPLARLLSKRGHSRAALEMLERAASVLTAQLPPGSAETAEANSLLAALRVR